jgi:hypothetical protein
MAEVYDYSLDENADLIISNGDFARTEAGQQAVILVLNTNQGSWKWNPFCGMGIKKYKGASGVNLQMKREMIVQLQADKYKVNSIDIRDYDDFYIDCERQGI